jgi:ABC-type transport system substrate-binding protein
MAFARIEFCIVTDDQAALLAYWADAFDYTSVTVASVDQLKSAMPPASVLIEAESTRYAWLTINKNAETLKDIKVRQAIWYACDGDAVLQGAFSGLVGRSTGNQYLSLELALVSFAGGVDPTENLVWFRADQIGIYSWSFFDDPECETLYKASLSQRDQAKRTAIFNRMEEPGCFVFICFKPLIAIHRDTIKPVNIADAHSDPTL